MRHLILPLAALSAFVVGCNKSPEGGTAGTPASFKLSLPTSKDIKQGATETYDASIDRGKEFKEDIKLKVEAPAKLDAKLTKDEIKAAEGDTKFGITVKAEKDAPIGEHEVKVTGTPAKGSAVTHSFKVKVTAP